MQRYPDNISEADRRIARRWTLGSVGIYGSILAAMILYAALTPRPTIQLASGEPANMLTANAARPSPVHNHAK